METETQLTPTAQVIPDYEKELTEGEERTINNVVAVLNKNSVSEEITRARILAKHKAFIRDVFNAGVSSGIL